VVISDSTTILFREHAISYIKHLDEYTNIQIKDVLCPTLNSIVDTYVFTNYKAQEQGGQTLSILSPLLQFYLLFCILISITISILFCNLLVRSGAYLDIAEDKNCKREDKKVPKFGPPAWGDKKVQKLNPQGKQIKRGGLKLLVDKSPSNYFTVN